MNSESVTAVCATVTLIGVFGLFLVKAVIKSSFNELMEDIRKEFVSKDQFNGLEARFNDSFRVHRGNRGD